jgi:pimeloyl-ACP methyl ester carboxylesterase
LKASSWRKWTALSVAVGLVALVSPTLMRQLGKQHLRFPYLTGSLGAEQYAALAAAPGWAATSLAVTPSVSLNGLIRRPTSREAPWVFFLSGNDPTPLATAQKFLERLRNGADWGLVTYAYRGYDSSGGSPDRDAIAQDTLKAFDDLLAREQVQPARVHVVAFSLGAYFAAHLVGTAAQTQRKVASLSLLNGAEDLMMVHWRRLGNLAPGDVYETQPLLDAVPAPVLVVQGADDDAIGAEQGRKISARLGSRARYIELPGVKHADLLENEAGIAAAREMIQTESGSLSLRGK